MLSRHALKKEILRVRKQDRDKYKDRKQNKGKHKKAEDDQLTAPCHGQLPGNEARNLNGG